MLADITWQGAPLKVMLWANRNGFFYVLDRATGKFLLGQAVREGELDERLRRTRPADSDAAAAGQPTWPGNQGGTNWYSPSYSPRTGLFYVPAWEDYATIFGGTPVEYQAGRNFGGGVNRPLRAGARRAGRARHPARPDQQLDRSGRPRRGDRDRSATGEQKWKFPMTDVTDSGILTTASDLLFTGGREGYFQALDARTGALLWKASLGGQIVSGPITYEVDGKQYVAAISGLSLCVFGLRE